MRIVTITAMISLLTLSSAFAADRAGALAAGKPAGVHQAQMFNDISPAVYFGVIAVGLGVAYAVTHDNDNTTTAVGNTNPGTSTTTTGTTA